jgi:hypothetical protein
MKREQEPVDVTEPLLELVRGLDFAFDQKTAKTTTPQGEQERYAAALAAIGRFLMKINPTHADRFFVLSDALADREPTVSGLSCSRLAKAAEDWPKARAV